MTQRKTNMGFVTSISAAGAVLVLVTASILAGDLRIQAAGLDVSMTARADHGFVVKIDGADCPGAGCPAFALNWKMANQG